MKPVNNSKDFCFLVVSCDNYSDLWPSFFQNLQEKFPIVNDYNIYLVSNYRTFSDYNVINVNVGDDISWSSNFIKALSKVAEENIFLLIDDLYLKNTVDKKDFQYWIDVFIENKMNYLRLTGNPKPLGEKFLNDIWKISQNEIYRTATVFSFWKRKVLLELLRDAESAWEFEYFGSDRAKSYPNWFSTKANVLPYHNLVIKGKIDPFVIKQIENENCKVVSNRERMNSKDVIIKYFKIFRSYIFNTLIPSGLQLKLRLILKNLLK